MKKLFLILITVCLVPFTAEATCEYIENKAKISELIELRDLAHFVMDAEGRNCENIESRELRTNCQCKFRSKPLSLFRDKYQVVLKKYPQLANKMVCFSQNEQSISINFKAYAQIKNWCL